ncbi:hypothetical protein P12x_004002 [Tundrisphaera lichenicola]|uniref:hypothetical protein n=1 Tax=Tundrisphaera lichenicola TaxID=2029860 RepID=UPI003EB95A0A
MDRRSLLLLSLLATPARLFGQDVSRRSSRSRRVSSVDDRTEDRSRIQPERAFEDDLGSVDPGSIEGTPSSFPNQSGFAWKSFSISDYTALAPASIASPQTAIIDWIFRRTTPAPWHGDKIAVLCANRSQLRAYNTPKILEQVQSVVERFIDAESNILNVRVRFIAASDIRWRYAVHQQLTPVGAGNQGQQIWQVSDQVAEMVINQMQVWQGFKLLENRAFEVLNGQTLLLSTTTKQAFTAGVQRDGAVGLGSQPKVEKLEEGVTLRFSPLLSYEGDTLDAAIDFSTNLVRKLHPVRVLSPRQAGPGEVAIDVPEVSESRLNQPVKNWPLGQALIISAGIQPGILLDKGGLFNLKIPGTVPNGTELLAIINVEVAKTRSR